MVGQRPSARPACGRALRHPIPDAGKAPLSRSLSKAGDWAAGSPPCLQGAQNQTQAADRWEWPRSQPAAPWAPAESCTPTQGPETLSPRGPLGRSVHTTNTAWLVQTLLSAPGPLHLGPLPGVHRTRRTREPAGAHSGAAAGAAGERSLWGLQTNGDETRVAPS